MDNWPNSTLNRCVAVDDIMSTLRGAGANIPHFPNPTVDETLNQGASVLDNDALWDALPPQIRIWPREKLRAGLRQQLDACR